MSTDAIVIGAGLSGLYALCRLREQGFRVRVFEAGGDVGGTWYWNRYPGARFDSESWTYGFSFSEDLLREWDWNEHFSAQPENLRYCNLVADKFDLRRDVTFDRRIAAARWDDAAGEWEVASTGGEQARARFLLTALGPLSAPVMPDIPGVAEFTGEAFHTGLWPHRPVSVYAGGAPKFRQRCEEVAAAGYAGFELR
jgi:cation diffusion facilitator CzcD-associated flavoprotein CzcO